jgi:hypothetical protein
MRAAAALDPMFFALGPDEVVFFTGAGISADPPTSGPVGNALADRTLDHAFASGTGATIARYYTALRLDRQRPRLETLLDVVFRVHGEVFFDDLLSDLRAGLPNALHGFFAEHLLSGGHHATANFDTCIERAAPAGAPVDVLHFHGSFGGAALGATLARIERGFPSGVRATLERTLLDPAVKLVVFMGYSGSDFFDVDPVMRSLPAGALAGRSVVWVSHDTTNPPRAVLPERKQLRWLHAAGASPHEINAPTRDIAEGFACAWGFTLTDPPGTAAPWRATFTASYDAKQRATLELYALMGLHNEVRQLLPRPTTASEWEILANTLWAQGRYSAAGDAWEKARAGATETSRAERRGAVLWIRGQFSRARHELLEALGDPSASFEERLVVAELLARVLTHMRRFPDSRLVPVRRVHDIALASLPDPAALASAGEPLGTHLRVRVASARAALGAGESQERPIESFGEFEALGGQLNYRHGAIRERLRYGRGSRVTRSEVRQLREDFLTIGADGDAARAVLLEGLRSYGPRQLIQAAAALDVSRWHRVRLVMASVFGSSVRPLQATLRRYSAR